MNKKYQNTIKTNKKNKVNDNKYKAECFFLLGTDGYRE